MLTSIQTFVTNNEADKDRFFACFSSITNPIKEEFAMTKVSINNPRRKVNIKIGDRFGRLTVIKDVGKIKGRLHFECICDCGNTYTAMGKSIYSGHTKSCGCLWMESITKHGMYKTATYEAWSHIIQRCTNPKDKIFYHYGGRGITVCDRWSKFENFLEDMKEKPEGLTIERIDNDKGYSKENCCWDTQTAQSRNQRLNIKNKTGVRGVYWHKKNKKYCVQITVNYKTYHIGLFSNIEQAAIARKEAEEFYWR